MRTGPPPRPKKVPKNAPKSVSSRMKKNGLKKLWEVKRTPKRKDDKAFVTMGQDCNGSKCRYKLIRFGSIASEKERFDSKDRMKRFRNRHGCDKGPMDPLTAKYMSCNATWWKYDPPKTVRNCSNCG